MALAMTASPLWGVGYGPWVVFSGSAEHGGA